MMSSSWASGRAAHRCAAPSSATASASLPGSRPASRSPRRWLQVIPAACMNVASPICCGAVGQPGRAQPAGVQPGQAGPAVQGAGQRGGQVAAGRVMPAGDQAGPGERRGGQQRLVVAGQHRHGPGPVPVHRHDDAAGAAVMSLPRTARRSARISPAPAPRQTRPAAAHPPRRRGLGGGEREIAVDLRRAVGCLGALAGQRRVRRRQLRDRRAGPGTAGWSAASAASRRSARARAR